jgi:hypothetical protein
MKKKPLTTKEVRIIVEDIFTNNSVNTPRGFNYSMVLFEHVFNRCLMGEDYKPSLGNFFLNSTDILPYSKLKSHNLASLLNYNYGFPYKDCLDKVVGDLGKVMNDLRRGEKPL